MRYWWVNQNKTYKQEYKGGYLWSPKRTANDSRNPYYEFMREVAPGDLIFSFKGTRIPAIGIAQSFCYECPKPNEFGAVGNYWNEKGWKVEVNYIHLHHKVRPKDYFAKLKKHLPDTYSPLNKNGNGKQNMYLTQVPKKLASFLITLIGTEAQELLGYKASDAPDVSHRPITEIIKWEDELAKVISAEKKLSDTEKESIIIARRGQGTFKKNVQKRESKCRITGVNKIEHLIASHCKPWRSCETHAERLDGDNGLLLTPSIDRLFDRGLISFENNGRLLISPIAHKESLSKMGVPVGEYTNVGHFSAGQKKYLGYHRERLFKVANQY